MKQFPFLLPLLFLAACASYNPWQPVLSGTVPVSLLSPTDQDLTETDAKTLKDKLRREAKQNGVQYQANLVLPAVTKHNVQTKIYRLGQKDDPAAKKIINQVIEEYETKLCFTFGMKSAHKGDRINPAYWGFEGMLDDQRVPLEILQIKEPEMTQSVKSFTTGGYGHQIGRTFYYTPAETHVYSTKDFYSSGTVCSKKLNNFKLSNYKKISLISTSRFTKADVPIVFDWIAIESKSFSFR